MALHSPAIEGESTYIACAEDSHGSALLPHDIAPDSCRRRYPAHGGNHTIISNVRVALGLYHGRSRHHTTTGGPAHDFGHAAARRGRSLPCFHRVPGGESGRDLTPWRCGLATSLQAATSTSQPRQRTRRGTWTSWAFAALEPAALHPCTGRSSRARKAFSPRVPSGAGTLKPCFAPCDEVYRLECGPTQGNVLTVYNGASASGRNAEHRYVLHVDHGDFSLTQTRTRPYRNRRHLTCFALGLVGVAVRRHRLATAGSRADGSR